MSTSAYVQFTYHPDDELGGVMHSGLSFEVKEKSRAVILATIKMNHAGTNHQIKSIEW